MEVNPVPALMLLFFIVVVWVGFSIFNVATTTTIDPKASQLANTSPRVPLKIDVNKLNRIVDRIDTGLVIKPAEFKQNTQVQDTEE